MARRPSGDGRPPHRELYGDGCRLRLRHLGRWVSPGELHIHHVRYVIVNSKETAAGYGFATLEFAAWLARHAKLVFSFTDRSYGQLGIYRVPRPC